MRRTISPRSRLVALLAFVLAGTLVAGRSAGAADGEEGGRVGWPGPREAGLGTPSAASREPAVRSETVRAAARSPFERIAERLRASDNPYVGRAGLARARAAVERGGGTSEVRIDARLTLAAELLKHGDARGGLRQAESALALAEDGGVRRRALLRALDLCGLASLRLAEVENCVARHANDCCILPLAGGGLHAVREPAERAMGYYRRSLGLRGDPEAAWLLNVAAMALGEYPLGVPRRWRVPPAVFESAVDVGRFEDVAARGGVDTLDLCGGVIADDFDGDAIPDLITSTFDLEGPLRFHHGNGDLTFRERTEEAGLSGQLGGLNCIAGDHDGDGDLDVLVLRGAWMFDDGRIPNSLLQNDGAARFADVTEAAGIRTARPTQAACFADLEGDGDLDLFVGNESRVELDPPHGDYPSELWRNRGDGTFADAAVAAGVENDRYCKGVTAGDFDNDGDVDLYVSNIGRNRLYRNEGGLRFTDVAPELGVQEPADRSFATWFFDYDNDGWLDLFVAAYASTLGDVVTDALGRPNRGVPPRLYHNEGGSFRDATEEAGLRHSWLPMGANFGDLDDDGWLDVYLGTGAPSYETLVPNVMLRNDGGVRFQDVTSSGGFGHLQKGHGIAFCDLDLDGDEDVYAQLGGFYPGDAFPNALFENPGHGNHWIGVRLRGTRNRFGVGARLRVVVERDGRRREVHRAVGSVSSFGGSPLEQHVGLGACERVLLLEVDWPGGARQRFEDVPLDTRLVVTEGGGLEALGGASAER